MGKAPPMNMTNFDRGVWVLHRRLHHRLLKFFTQIQEATDELEDYQNANDTEAPATIASSSASGKQVICLLLSSDSEDADETDADSEDADETDDE